MPNALRTPPPRMTVADFIAWPGLGMGWRSQLVDGEVCTILPGSVLLRRGPDGSWPEETAKIGPGGTLSFESIGFSCPLSEVYAQTHLGDGDPS